MPNPGCPPGQLINGSGNCVPAIAPSGDVGTTPATAGTCPAGSHWNAGLGTCQPNEVSTHPVAPPLRAVDPSTGPPCPDGQHWNNNAKQCRPGPGPTTTTGTGGGAGGAGATANLFDQGMPGGDIESMIMDHIRSILGGQDLPFSRDTVERLKTGALGTAKSQETARRGQLQEDLIDAGTYRGNVLTRGQLDIGRDASAQYSDAANKIEITAQAENHKAKLDALDRAQAWLDHKRAYLLQTEDNKIKLKVGLAQIDLGYAKIAAEREMLMMQLNAQGGGGSQQTTVGGVPSQVWDLLSRLFGGGNA